MSNETRSCFVVGPIGSSPAPVGSDARKVFEDAQEVLEQVIAPACQEVGLDAVRADTISVTGDLTEQIFRRLRDADVVIADLTGANPNVMYELGLRHTIDKLTIQIGEFGSLPFDISSIRTIMFSRSPHGLTTARKSLVDALQIGLADNGDLLPATRIWNEASFETITSVNPIAESAHEEEADDVDELPGFLEQMADMEATFPELTSITGKISNEVEDLGRRAQSITPRMTELTQTNAPISQRLALLSTFATEISQPAQNLDDLASKFSAQMEKLDGTITSIIDFLEKNPSLINEDSRTFLSSINGLGSAGRSGLEGLGSMVPGLETMAGLSRTLRRPAQQTISAVTKLSGTVEMMDVWAIRAQKLLAVSENA